MSVAVLKCGMERLQCIILERASINHPIRKATTRTDPFEGMLLFHPVRWERNRIHLSRPEALVCRLVPQLHRLRQVLVDAAFPFGVLLAEGVLRPCSSVLLCVLPEQRSGFLLTGWGFLLAQRAFLGLAHPGVQRAGPFLRQGLAFAAGAMRGNATAL